MRQWIKAPAVCLLAAALFACAPRQVRTEPLGPTLEAPVPPSHVVAPLEAPPTAELAAPATGDANPNPGVTRTPSRSQPPRTDKPASTAKPEKPDPAPATPPKPSEEAAASPAVTLQTTANVDEEERKIRAVLAKAAADLGQVDPKTLTSDRKSQYDTARRFAEQAEGALKEKNVVFAKQLADKAATLAGLLVKR